MGIIVSVSMHKTADNGSADVWFSETDMLLIQAYMVCVEKFAASQNKEVGMMDPIFVNQNLTPWKTSKRLVNYGEFCLATGCPKFNAHDARRMFGSYLGSADSLILRESAALASNHT